MTKQSLKTFLNSAALALLLSPAFSLPSYAAGIRDADLNETLTQRLTHAEESFRLANAQVLKCANELKEGKALAEKCQTELIRDLRLFSERQREQDEPLKRMKMHCDANLSAIAERLSAAQTVAAEAAATVKASADAKAAQDAEIKAAAEEKEAARQHSKLAFEQRKKKKKKGDRL